jgi:glycosyltransferase involved in cell wall biosynthesis
VGVFGDLEDPFNNDRLNNILDYGVGVLHICLVTSDYSHKYKRKRDLQKKEGMEIHQVKTLPYPSNTGILRFISHFLLAVRSLPVLWRETKKSDIVYILTPPLTLPFFQVLIAKTHKTKIVLDFTDIWPQAFSIFVKNRLLKAAFAPLEILQRIIIRSSDVCIVINRKYAEILNSSQNPKFHLIPLGIPKDKQHGTKVPTENSSDVYLFKLKEWKRKGVVFCFGGNIGTAYDFKRMIEIVNGYQLNYGSAYFIIVGDGDRRDELQQMLLEEARFDYEITGRLAYQDFLRVLSFCDFGFNLYKPTPFISTTYKMYDYMKSNLWLINNLEGDSEEMIEAFRIGINCRRLSNQETLVSLRELAHIEEVERIERMLKINQEYAQEQLKERWLNLVLDA